MNRRPAPVAPALALAFLALPAVALAAPVDGRLSLSGEKVHVYSLAGEVRIGATTGTSVTIEPTTGGRDRAQIDVQTIAGKEPALVFKTPGKTVIYRPDGMRGSYRTTMEVGSDGRFGDGWGKNGLGLGRQKIEIRSSGSGTEAWTDLVIGVPKGQAVVVHLGVGGVAVANVDGDLRVDCAAGGVEAEGTRGHLSIDTGSGGVEVKNAMGMVDIDTGSGGVSVSDFTGRELSVDTGSGSVRLATVKADARISVDTGSGRVEAIGVRTPKLDIDTGSGGVLVQLAATVDDLMIDTGSGSVTVEAPSTLDARITLSTGSGGLDVDFPLQSLNRDDDSLTGTIGRGTGRVVIETGSGRIRLTKV